MPNNKAKQVKKQRIADLLETNAQLTELASSECHDSCDWYNEGPQDTDLSYWELLDDNKNEIIKLVKEL